jgi:hypothetical protein
MTIDTCDTIPVCSDLIMEARRLSGTGYHFVCRSRQRYSLRALRERQFARRASGKVKHPSENTHVVREVAIRRWSNDKAKFTALLASITFDNSESTDPGEYQTIKALGAAGTYPAFYRRGSQTKIITLA